MNFGLLGASLTVPDFMGAGLAAALVASLAAAALVVGTGLAAAGHPISFRNFAHFYFGIYSTFVERKEGRKEGRKERPGKMPILYFSSVCLLWCMPQALFLSAKYICCDMLIFVDFLTCLEQGDTGKMTVVTV